jgi:hypothetical protein
MGPRRDMSLWLVGVGRVMGQSLRGVSRFRTAVWKGDANTSRAVRGGACQAEVGRGTGVLWVGGEGRACARVRHVRVHAHVCTRGGVCACACTRVRHEGWAGANTRDLDVHAWGSTGRASGWAVGGHKGRDRDKLGGMERT